MKNNEIILENKRFRNLMSQGLKTNVVKYLNVLKNEQGSFTISELVKKSINNQLFQIVPSENSIISIAENNNYYNIEITKNVSIDE